jgi:putative ABC transport system permease protein
LSSSATIWRGVSVSSGGRSGAGAVTSGQLLERQPVVGVDAQLGGDAHRFDGDLACRERGVAQQGARGGERAQTFIPYWQFPELAGGTSFALRTAVAPELVTPALARAVKDVDPEVPVARLVPMSQLVFDSIEEPRFLARITALFAALAMLLAALGVYGVTSYAVTQRLPEIGVRLALGARRRDVFRLVFGSGLRLAAFGVAFGSGAALLLGPALRTLLFEVAPADPLTFAFTAAGLLLVAAMATLIPARRATRVDPVTALREN